MLWLSTAEVSYAARFRGGSSTLCYEGRNLVGSVLGLHVRSSGRESGIVPDIPAPPAPLPAELNAPTMGNAFGRSTTVAVMYCAFLASSPHGFRPVGAGEATRRERARTVSAEFSSNEQAASLILDTPWGQQVTATKASLHTPSSRRNGLRLLRKGFHLSTI